MIGDRSTVGLRPADELSVDVLQFRALPRSAEDCRHQGDEGRCVHCVSTLREAVELCRAPFLDEFTLPDGPGFDDWQIAEREALADEFGRAIARLVGHYIAHGDGGEAVVYARRWHEDDLLSEAACRELMRAFAVDGRRAEALRSFE